MKIKGYLFYFYSFFEDIIRELKIRFLLKLKITRPKVLSNEADNLTLLEGIYLFLSLFYKMLS